MCSFKTSLFAAAAILMVSVAPVRAEIFVWQDPETGYSVSFPDRWEVVTNQQPDDVLTIRAPAQNDQAVCRLRVRDDRRFVIYPPRYSAAVQNVAYSDDFWAGYLNEYKDVTIHNITDNAGLGRGFAGHAQASFTAETGYNIKKRGVMFATLYNGRAYIAECSAQEQAYHGWHKSFLSVMKSVNFKKAHHEHVTGHYRDFTKDRKLRIRDGYKDIDLSYH